MKEILHKILVINPGSTSTKVSLFEDSNPVLQETLEHPHEELVKCHGVWDQFEIRRQAIAQFLENNSVNYAELSAVVGRGGLLRSIPGGTYGISKKMIEDVLSSTMGFEIVSQGEKSCTIKSIARAVEEEFDNILRRVFLTLLSMADESYDAASKSQFARLKDIESSDKTINKLTNFCKRILNKKGYKDEKSANYIYCIVWEIERIGDEYRRICTALGGWKKQKISKDILNLFRNVNIFLRDFYSFFYKFEQDKGIALTKSRGELLKKAESLMKKEKGECIIVLHHLANIINSVYDIVGPYYAMVL